MQLILVLLVVYALVLMPFMSLVMMGLVRRAAQSRLRLFSVFMQLPRPTIMALASKSITVTGKQSSAPQKMALPHVCLDLTVSICNHVQGVLVMAQEMVMQKMRKTPGR